MPVGPCAMPGRDALPAAAEPEADLGDRIGVGQASTLTSAWPRQASQTALTERALFSRMFAIADGK
jgi:hypothetical protein